MFSWRELVIPSSVGGACKVNVEQNQMAKIDKKMESIIFEKW